MREIKFRAFRRNSKSMSPALSILEWITLGTRHGELVNSDDVVWMQYTGLKDVDGVEIYEGDILNICYTSGGGEHIHDCIYKVSFNCLGTIEFRFVNLLWEDAGHNQYPISTTLSERYGTLDCVHDGDRLFLCVSDVYSRDVSEDRRFPFNEEKILSFSSRYFKVIGNIHLNPELLESSQC